VGCQVCCGQATGVMPGRPTPDVVTGQSAELAAMSAAVTRKRRRMANLLFAPSSPEVTFLVGLKNFVW
jgi:hypothetical protein